MTDLQARPVDQRTNDAHPAPVDGATLPPPASDDTTPRGIPLVVDHSHPDQAKAETTPRLGAPGPGDPSAATSQSCHDTQLTRAGDGTPSTPATDQPTPNVASPGSALSEPPIQGDVAPHHAADGWLELRIWAEMYFDAQQTKQAQQNRARRGGVDPALYEPGIEALDTAESVIERQAILCYRQVVPPAIRAWQKDTRGIGELLLSRLLGHLGHPVHATPHHWEGTGAKRVLIADEPHDRTISQLWQYCGHGRPGRAKKGASAADLAALGSPTTKKIVHLNAEAIVKAGIRRNHPDVHPAFDPDTRRAISTFGQVYYDRRVDTWDKTHSVECVRCGPSGKPAQPGSPWSPGHQQGDALRIVGKELLRDLWKVSQ